jgi:hypothetical protein
MRYLFVIAVLFVTLAACLKTCQAGAATEFVTKQQALISKLLTGYNADIRPEGLVVGDYYFILQQLIDVNEVTQIMTTSINVYMRWIGRILSITYDSQQFH